jgi:predicted HicB family RNase H-like nuclease
MRHNKDLPPLELFALRISPEQIEAIKAKADHLMISASEVVRRCIERSLEKLK